MFRVRDGNVRVVIEPDTPRTQEEPAAVPAVPLRPQRQGREVGRSTDCGPGIRILRIGKRATVDLAREVDEQRPISGKVRTPIVDAALEPLARLKTVAIGPPLQELNPVARAAAENDGNRNGAGQQDAQPAGHLS